MPPVFVNYRTGDGEHLATVLFQSLNERFGEGTVFRASDSIRASQTYEQELLRGVRRASVLLVVVGPTWASAPQLHDETDWVRREILEAFACGIPVIPVLASIRVKRLRSDELPAPLKQLAGLQSVRYDTNSRDASLSHLLDELLYVVPELNETQKDDSRSGTERGSTSNTVSGGHQGFVIQGGGEVSGDIQQNTFGNVQGPVHTGKGDQSIHHHLPGTHVSHGKGATHFSGDNNGWIQPNTDGGQPAEGEEQ
ncbi:toll/interleukin-1 receptor domain-containing protein [Streptomyces sp. SCSIO ZS0520]|uniref:toll/interleukin-1 receptor domain-containing protein n=1 Tax=Streptomyces sp. SCSIO ZS0520 TaxID=2892996 RepID=UPI0021D9CA0A|nr:toll/interleukin-1 receptor domain-containing protein [Streptomyces sp. SCSIO ZS0520]